jgi:hypothetical protein
MTLRKTSGHHRERSPVALLQRGTHRHVGVIPIAMGVRSRRRGLCAAAFGFARQETRCDGIPSAGRVAWPSSTPRHVQEFDENFDHDPSQNTWISVPLGSQHRKLR